MKTAQKHELAAEFTPSALCMQRIFRRGTFCRTSFNSIQLDSESVQIISRDRPFYPNTFEQLCALPHNNNTWIINNCGQWNQRRTMFYLAGGLGSINIRAINVFGGCSKRKRWEIVFPPDYILLFLIQGGYKIIFICAMSTRWIINRLTLQI